MTVFENDYLMGYKPRRTALLSHRDIYIPAQLFTIRGAKAKALGQVNLTEAQFPHFWSVCDYNIYLVELVWWSYMLMHENI